MRKPLLGFVRLVHNAFAGFAVSVQPVCSDGVAGEVPSRLFLAADSAELGAKDLLWGKLLFESSIILKS